jgi:hypothetical protein
MLFFIGGSALGSLSLIYIFVKDTIQHRNIRACQGGDCNIVINHEMSSILKKMHRDRYIHE